LELNGLKVVSQFVLDVCHLGDAGCDLLIHGACYLQVNIDSLTIKIKGPIKHVLIQGTLCFLHKVLNILVLDLKGLQNWEKVSNITSLEWEVFIQEKFLVWQDLNIHRILFIFLTTSLSKDVLRQLLLEISLVVFEDEFFFDIT